MIKPTPRPTAETAQFWRACADGVLTFQRCTACGHAQFYPRALCVRCQSRQLSWERSGRRGQVHSFTVVHRAPSAAFGAESPYVIALIDLDEGVRMLMNIVGSTTEAVRIGMPVEIVFESRGEMRLPQARARSDDV